MRQQINHILHERFGYETFRVGQEETITAVLSGKDTLAMLPTGTGKSLCYQLPAYLLDGTVLIISPLLSLMQDQVENLKLQGERRVVALNSQTSQSERKRIFQNLNKYRFIYTSPEMLQNPQVIQALKRIKISLFVVDEAHCISHWGTDFRPDYLVLANIKESLGNPTTLALTATATAQVRQEIIGFLGLDEENVEQIIQSVDRPEIKFIVKHCNRDKDDHLLEYLKQLKGPGIIYFMSKKLADEWSEKLCVNEGISAASYHADIDSDDKSKIQQQFLMNELQVICATSAFGMGFDKQDIRFVIHYHLPASIEMYLQEVGRASRDGKEGLAILLYEAGDEQIQWHFINESLPSKNVLEEVYSNKIRVQFHDDPVLKLADYFLQSSINIEEAFMSIEYRKKIKVQQLYSLLAYVQQGSCKREILLRYFEESLQVELAGCCSKCGLDEMSFIQKLNRITNYDYSIEENVGLRTWKTILESLYISYND